MLGAINTGAVAAKAARMGAVDARVSIYLLEQPGLIFPEIPTFQSFEEERVYRKQHLVAAARAFAMHGFDYGFAGHLTVGGSERPELYRTNPMCVHFSHVKMLSLILADHAGRVVEGRHAIDRTGFVLHGALHEMHPEIMAMWHAHTTFGRLVCHGPQAGHAQPRCCLLL